jgi:hypothetical protein
MEGMFHSDHKSRRALVTLLRQPSTYGSVAFIGLCDVLPKEWLEWEPKTVQLEIQDELGVLLEPDMFDKIMAARQAVTTDQAFTSLPAFITLANALNGDGVDTPVSQPIDPADLSWAVLEMCLLYPPGSGEVFSEEIIGYIQESLAWQGVRGVPNSLVKILPEATFDETVADDSETMQLLFDRLNDINEEVIAHLNAWRYQMKQLHLTHGGTEFVEDLFRK